MLSFTVPFWIRSSAFVGVGLGLSIQWVQVFGRLGFNLEGAYCVRTVLGLGVT